MARYVWHSALLAVLFEAGWALSAASMQAPVAKVLSQMTLKTIQALQDGRTVRLERRTAKVELTGLGGKLTVLNVLMAREPSSGLFWWTYKGASRTAATRDREAAWQAYRLYLTGDKVVGFSFVPFPPRIGLREISGHKADLAAVQQTAVAELEGVVGSIQDGSFSPIREVALNAEIDSDFFHLAGSAAPFPQPKIIAVGRAEGRWTVTLEGPNRDTVTITLDDRYTVVNIRHQPVVR